MPQEMADVRRVTFRVPAEHAEARGRPRADPGLEQQPFDAVARTTLSLYQESDRRGRLALGERLRRLLARR